MQGILRVQDVSKAYANGFQALKHINPDIRCSEIFALLGPNWGGEDHADQHRVRHRQRQLGPGDGGRARHSA